MAGYTRQSAASIINGENITAPPLNAEFNQLESSFNDTTGHAHDGTTGNGPKIDLTTSITGFLPAEHGGFGGKNNYVATTNPGVGDDTNDGYAVGSVWYNVPDDRYWVCVYAAAGAAVWLENRFIDTNGDIAPFATNTVDLGATLKRFKDLFLSGNADIDGSLNVATTAYVGGTLTVAGSTLLNGDITLGNSATDDINVTARFKDDLVPGTDDTYDLGSSTLQWRNIWIDGTANIDTLDVHENATVTGTLGVTGDATFVNLDATGTTTITSVDLNSGAIDNATIGSNTPAAATVTTLTSTGLATLASVDVNGGNVDNTVIGGTTPAAGTFTNLTSSGTSTHATVDINGGNIDATVIGASSAAAGSFTSLTTSGQATLATVDINGGNIDGAAIGSTTTSSGAFTTLSASGGITGTLTGNVTGNVTGDITGDVTGDLTGNVTAASGSSSFNNVTINGSLNMNAGTSATITNLTAPVNTLDAATKGYVDTSIANLVDSAPGTLDTLNELAAALGDDPNFSATITASIATKLSLNGGTMAGDIAMGSNSITGLADPAAAQDAATKNYTDTTFLALSGGTMTGAVDMGSNKVTSSATPSTGNDLTNKTYVDGILGSATAASASAAAAASSENNAATSAGSASNSATAAAGSATSAAASLSTFQNQYLGAQSSAPTQDPDGSALDTGDLYFDTTTDTMKVYGSSGWVNAGSSVNGTSDRQTYTATAGQTVFAATYDAGYVDVYLNGVKLLAGTDFTATNGTSITLASGAAVNDIVDIVAYGTFVLADHLTETQSDAKYVQQTHTGNVSIDGTFGIGTSSPSGPFHIVDGRDELSFTNGSNNVYLSLTAGFNTKNSVLNFYNTSDAGYGRIDYDHATEYMAFSTNSSEAMRITSSGSVGIGTDSPTSKLEVNVDGTSAITVRSSDGGQANLIFGDQADADRGRIVYSNADESMRFAVNNLVEAARIDSSGNLGLGTQTPQSYTNQTSLTINGSTTGRLDLQGNGVQGGTIFSTNGTGMTVQTGYGKSLTLESGTTADTLFRNNGSESMRISQYGDLLVGKPSTAFADEGAKIGTAGGSVHFVRASDTPVFIRRNTNEGDFLKFYKDSTSVGAIGTTGTLFYMESTSGAGFRLVDDDMRPSDNGVNADNTFDLGNSNARWRDLYLSGGVYLGGTGSANKLDDYESGSWTPTITGGFTGSGLGEYTKVGDIVYVTANLYRPTDTSSSTEIQIGGWPFTPASLGHWQLLNVSMRYVNVDEKIVAGVMIDSSSTYHGKILIFNDSGSDYQYLTHSASTSSYWTFQVSGTYKTA